MGRGWGCRGVGWDVKGRERGRRIKHIFQRGEGYTFIISSTFARGRYSLIVYCFSAARGLECLEEVIVGLVGCVRGRDTLRWGARTDTASCT